MKQEDIKTIDRYIKGIADDSEKKYVESIFLKKEINLYLRNCLEKEWNSLIQQDASAEIDLNPLLDRIHHIIRKNETVISRKPMQKLLKIYMKAAAVLLIPLVLTGGLLYYHLTNNRKAFEQENAVMQIYAPMGSRVSFNLPDGTKGMLNSGSRLIKP